MVAPSALWMVAARLASQGACRGVDPELFFPVGSSGPALHQIAQAKAVCAGCLVRDDCLGYAVTTGQSAGIWGGATEEERRKIQSVASVRAPRQLRRAVPLRREVLRLCGHSRTAELGSEAFTPGRVLRTPVQPHLRPRIVRAL